MSARIPKSLAKAGFRTSFPSTQFALRLGDDCTVVIAKKSGGWHWLTDIAGRYRGTQHSGSGKSLPKVIAAATSACKRASTLGEITRKTESQNTADKVWRRYYDQELQRLLDNNAEASVSRNTARWYASHMTGRQEP